MKTDRSHPTGKGARTTTSVLAVALASTLAAAGCADDPFAPETPAMPDAPALQAAFLLGGSPLTPASAPALKTQPAPDGSISREIEVGFQVSVPALGEGGGAFVIRTSADFYGVVDPKVDPVASVDPKDDPVATIDPKGDPVAHIDPKNDPVATVDPKDDPVALVVIALPIDKDTWAAIEKSAPKTGDRVEVVVTAELLLIAKDGSETTIDRVTTTGAIDPRDDPANDPK